LAPVLTGMEKETAQKEYIALVKELSEKYAK
jgi:acyl-CoA-binding protein